MRTDGPAEAGAAAPDIVMITGLSGAGRSTAAKSLEDLDWFVADNLPPDLLPTMADLARRAQGAVPRLAAVVDIRSRAFSTDLKTAISDLTRARRPALRGVPRGQRRDAGAAGSRVCAARIRCRKEAG